MSAALSRRVGRLMDIPPIFWLDAVERGGLARAVHKAKDFSELSPEYQRLILEPKQRASG